VKAKFKDLVKIYMGEKSFTIDICGLKRELPICRVDKNVWIVSNHSLVLGRDVEFTKRVGKKLSDSIKEFNPDYLITAESKSLPLAFKISEQLHLQEMIVARKNVKSYMENSYIETSVKSITTAEPQRLILESDQAEKIRGRRVAIVDDVVSTGGTLKGLESLVEKACGIKACKAAVWLEGPWYRGKDLIYLGVLPVFVSKMKFEKLKKIVWDNE
jgi:adenine phosphoribosyltransferase